MPLSEEEDRLLTVNEAADILVVPPQTVKLWLKNGTLPGFRSGSTWRVAESAIRNFLGVQELPAKEKDE